MATGEFEDRERQSNEYIVSPRGSDVPRINLPRGSSGIDVPGYTVDVTSTFDTRPINAYDENDSGYADANVAVGNATYAIDVNNVVTCVYTYTIPISYIFVLRNYQISLMNVSGGLTNFYPTGSYGDALPTLTIAVNGSYVKQHNLMTFKNGVEYVCHYVVPQNSVLTITAIADQNIFNYLAFQAAIRGNLLLSRQYPANLEVGSIR